MYSSSPVGPEYMYRILDTSNLEGSIQLKQLMTDSFFRFLSTHALTAVSYCEYESHKSNNAPTLQRTYTRPIRTSAVNSQLDNAPPLVGGGDRTPCSRTTTLGRTLEQ